MPQIKILKAGDEAVLANVAEGVFDNAVNQNLASEFLRDPRHHLAVSIENGLVVGMASAVHYVHPDKRSQLWINEVGVAEGFRGRGIAKGMLAALLEVGSALGCTEAWVLTDRANLPAMRLYSSVGGIANDQVMFTFPLHKSEEPGVKV